MAKLYENHTTISGIRILQNFMLKNNIYIYYIYVYYQWAAPPLWPPEHPYLTSFLCPNCNLKCIFKVSDVKSIIFPNLNKKSVYIYYIYVYYLLAEPP